MPSEQYVQDYLAFFLITMFYRLYLRVGTLLIYGKHLHDHTISLRREVWSNKTSKSPPLFIEVTVPSQERERSCICVLRGISCLFQRFVCWILELFRHCFFFHFMLNLHWQPLYMLYIYIRLLTVSDHLENSMLLSRHHRTENIVVN